jgi:hypothetical protein
VATASICSGDEMISPSSTDRSIRSWPDSIAAIAAWRRIVAIPPMEDWPLFLFVTVEDDPTIKCTITKLPGNHNVDALPDFGK